MKKFSMNIAQKLMCVAGIILLLAGGTLVNLVFEIVAADRVINGVIEEQAEILGDLKKIHAAGDHFDAMRYWLTDLSVSWMSESEDEADVAYETLTGLLDELESVDAKTVALVRPQIDLFKIVMLEAVDAYVDEQRVLGNASVAEGRGIAVEVADQLSQMAAKVNEQVEASTGELVQNNSELMQTGVIGLTIAVVVGTLLAWFSSRAISRPLQAAVEVANKIANGDFNNVISISSRDETGQLLSALDAMQKSLREQIEEERRVAAQNAAVKQALDTVSASVMLGDADNRVVYMNRAMTALLSQTESAIRHDISEFSADAVLHGNMDIFGRGDTLYDASRTGHRDISIGGHMFRIIPNPVMNESGDHVGTVIEWNDRTQEVNVENELNYIVEAALAGDMSQRISMEGKTGFFEQLSNGFNELLTVNGLVMEDVGRVMGAMAHGDLSESIDSEYKGDFARLKDDTNATILKLTQVLGSIKSSSGQVQVASLEISKGNASLSGRTEQQAATLEETSSAMEEMTATVKQNAEHAQEASRVSIEARDKAELGGEVVRRVVSAMSEINSSSKKIEDIIGVIDEIAFQTNLLALNAAVEAARAGEQGRGFAVVASEVRSLAGRSSAAAKEIKDLIQDSVSKVETGSTLVNESGETLDEIVSVVTNVTQIVGEISTASQEQSTGIEQVNRAILEMDEITQQNAALVEEVTASSVAMGEQAVRLMELVSFFDVGEQMSN
ncbi:MAG: methyl-accepting chemotaxis protein [Gammaproteobacteria bacterium]|nr:methyl-accepting chemotaxis protein [Gammaproteobacteria bacterium]